MKKLLLSMLLGFLLHKTLAGIYSYSWWTNNYICHETLKSADFNKQIECTHKRMGVVFYLRYALVKPD